jgi:hypothetical protein
MASTSNAQSIDKLNGNNFHTWENEDEIFPTWEGFNFHTWENEDENFPTWEGFVGNHLRKIIAICS